MQITQCPECHTAFKVSPEHLAVANGWVRCGRCGGVFEAMRHLEDDEVSSVGSAPSATTPSPSLQNAEATQKPRSGNSTSDARASEITAAKQPASVSPGSDIDDFHDSLMTFVPGALSSASSTHHEEASAFDSEPSVSREANQRQGWWWYLLSGLLGLGLMLQLVLWNRHLLVAQEPALQGLIEGLCAPLGCEWHWPQTLEAVQIENSSFTENADGTYRLQLRLKNTQHHAVAMPLLELTLTDERDDVVLRRVFQPQELGLKDHMPALRDARSTLNFDLDESLKPRVMGFRALIFYP
jgi:predicted Zn finger-like uncharacterized protein